MAAKPSKISKKSSKSKSTEEEEVKKSSTAIEKDVVSQEQEQPESSAKKSSKKKKKSKKNKESNDAALKSSSEKQREVEDKKKTESSKKKEKSFEKSTNNPGESESEEEDDDMKLTLEALDAISDYEDSDEEGNGEGSVDEGDEQMDHENDEWDAKALALRKAIQDGSFLAGLKKVTSKNKRGKGADERDEGVAEKMEDEMEEVEIDDDDEEEEEEELAQEEEETSTSDQGERNDDVEEEEEDNEEEEEQKFKAIALRTALQSTDRRLPWEETFAIVPPTPLPFGQADTAGGKKRKRDSVDEEDGDEEDTVIDIHDDLKREVAFHDCALEAVHLARAKCVKAGIPFTRPEDFFAEMVKTDGAFVFHYLLNFGMHSLGDLPFIRLSIENRLQFCY